MSVTNLEFLFKPSSVAVIGATNDPRNAGNIVMRNMMTGGFLGPVMPVTDQTEAIAGVLTHASIQDLPLTPDLAVVCSPLDEVPEILSSLKRKGTKGVVLMGAGFAALTPEERLKLKAAIVSIASPPDIRLIGPKSLGFMVPSLNLNASLAHSDIKPGKVAFISQSDSLFATVLDWAKAKGVGFSHMIALGSRIDVSFADILDYLSADSLTRSILLYVESIQDAREFMSAARAASRNKPILVIRPGQALDTVLGDLKLQETGDCRLSDAVYDVAFRRAGMLRVENIDGLFDAAQTLGTPRHVSGKKLAILTNGTSAGILAADRLLADGGELAELAEETLEGIDALLGAENWSRSNPVAIPFNSDGMTYTKVVKMLIKDQSPNALLVMHVPWMAQPDLEVAEALCAGLKRVKRMVLTAWLGSGTAAEAREVFRQSDVPTYETPSHAVRAFLYMAEFQRNQELLIERPDSLSLVFSPDIQRAKDIIAHALAGGRSSLTEPESEALLGLYGVPVVDTRIAVSAKEAVIAADEIGYPVALKLRSPQIPHPAEMGGILLDLETPERVWEGAATLLARCVRKCPDAYIEGYTVQKMGHRPGGHELFITVTVDPVFGPVLAFGHGGVARENIQDSALSLPPLSMSLAREMINRTRIASLLCGSKSQSSVVMDRLCHTLVQISQLIIDLPQITNLDINPFYADDDGVLAIGGKIRIAPFEDSGDRRLAIRPYPRELEETISLHTGRCVTLRPVRPEDEDAHRVFLTRLSDEDLRLRFFGTVRRKFDHEDIARFTQIDYDREMAFIAVTQEGEEAPETLGVMRTNTKPDNSEAEFAIVVRPDQQGVGLGALLFEKGIRYTKERGTKVLSGQTMVENKAMQNLSRKFGFSIKPDSHDSDLVTMTLDMATLPRRASR